MRNQKHTLFVSIQNKEPCKRLELGAKAVNGSIMKMHHKLLWLTSSF